MSEHSRRGDFDRAALERLVRFGGVKLLRGMADIFEESAPERRRVLEEPAESRDADAVRRTVHSLKSSAAQLGALRLSERCSEAEKALAAGADPEVAVRLVHAVATELDEALRWIRRTQAELEAEHADDRGS